MWDAIRFRRGVSGRVSRLDGGRTRLTPDQNRLLGRLTSLPLQAINGNSWACSSRRKGGGTANMRPKLLRSRATASWRVINCLCTLFLTSKLCTPIPHLCLFIRHRHSRCLVSECPGSVTLSGVQSVDSCGSNSLRSSSSHHPSQIIKAAR